MLDRRFVCTDCGKVSPDSGEESALISTKYGWRLARRTDAPTAAPSSIEARCPDCWARFRKSRAG
jgi:hypothetical protein